MDSKEFTPASILLEEQDLMNKVYAYMGEKLDYSKKQYEKALSDVENGRFDDNNAFISYNDLTRKKSQYEADNGLYGSLHAKPYFAHMGVFGSGKKEMLLSDNPELNILERIGNEGVLLVPFKDNSSAPMIPELYRQYAKLTTGGRKAASKFALGDTQYETDVVRNVEISHKSLNKVTQLYPKVEIGGYVDDLLDERLKENRNDAKLRNIISTIQESQYDIIYEDIRQSFVVQGCAGSGKSQCLIHRLFFLRDSLREKGWDKVLLITPTELFRNYSRELMHRYHLEDVNNNSLAGFYKTLLESYDQRFKNRQYRFELTEEFLPDEYLSLAYDLHQISEIDDEIDNAIRKHVGEAHTLLDIGSVPEHIDSDYVDALSKQIEKAIADFDKKSEELSKDPEYKDSLSFLADAEKQLAAMQKRAREHEEKADQLVKEKRAFDKLYEELAEAEKELQEWSRADMDGKKKLLKSYEDSIRRYGNIESVDEGKRERYRKAFTEVIDATLPYGKVFKDAEETREILKGLIQLAKEELMTFTNELPAKEWLKRFERRSRDNTDHRQDVSEKIADLNEKIASISERIATLSEEKGSIENQRLAHRAALERTKYYLSRMESSVFEQEIWNKLSPLKERYGITTVESMEMPDGHTKQTRILYKSDLLFYLMVYKKLHGTEGVPELTLVCIDEGQDLHSADYNLLRELYPKAVFNVFGDTNQVLHSSCGISDWKTETGIEKLFSLNTNYRNDPAIAAFCNKRFGSIMDAYGESSDSSSVQIISNADDLRTCLEKKDKPIIVKDRAMFKMFLLETKMDEAAFDYLDTKSISEANDRIRCYTIFAAKGLEFPKAVVYAKGMNNNQKTVACTRAMSDLCYYE